jgi:hypothetical protein
MIELCIADGTEEEKWQIMIPHYRQACVTLRTRHDMTNKEIESFQNEFDLFFQIWVGMYGDEGVTNYLHMPTSGHIMEYLFKYKNLYRHSQQGWEALNHLLRTFYFRQTGWVEVSTSGTSYCQLEGGYRGGCFGCVDLAEREFGNIAFQTVCCAGS